MVDLAEITAAAENRRCGDVNCTGWITECKAASENLRYLLWGCIIVDYELWSIE